MLDVAYRLTPEAEEDIFDIYLRSEEMFGPAQADAYFWGLQTTFEFLARNPRAARERAEFTPAVRAHPYQSHVVVYLLEGDDILIVRIRHGREDWLASPAGD